MPIEKRGDSYRARVRRKGRPGESATFPTLAHARAWEDRALGEIADARAGILPRRTVRQAIEEYQARECPKHEGRRWEQIRLDKFLRECGFPDRQIASVSVDDVARWRDRLTSRLATSSARREYGLVRSVFAVAIREWQWLKVSPFAALSPPAAGRPRKQRVSDADASEITEALGFSGAPPETASQFVAAAFLLAIQTACRQSELLRAERSDVYLDRRVLHIQKSKNGDEREVPLSKAALSIIELLPAEGFLFPIAAGTCDTLFRRARNSVNLEHIHFHDARREATTRLAKKVDVLTLARITGHRDVNLLLRVYYRPDMADVVSLLD